jgi:hypothetical protein
MEVPWSRARILQMPFADPTHQSRDRSRPVNKTKVQFLMSAVTSSVRRGNVPCTGLTARHVDLRHGTEKRPSDNLPSKGGVGMDHRWHVRESTSLHAMLRYSPLGFVRARLGNASVGGAFVQTESVSLHVNTPVDLMLRPSGRAGTFYRLPAFVVWAGQGCAGLMFRSFGQETREALRALLHGNVFGPDAVTNQGATADEPQPRVFVPRAIAR